MGKYVTLWPNLLVDVNTRFFIRTDYIRTKGSEGQRIKNLLRTFKGFGVAARR